MTAALPDNGVTPKNQSPTPASSVTHAFPGDKAAPLGGTDHIQTPPAATGATMPAEVAQVTPGGTAAPAPNRDSVVTPPVAGSYPKPIANK